METTEGFGDLKFGHVNCAMKSADELVLLAKEEVALPGMLDRQTDIGRGYGMKMNAEESKVIRV
jgi:hypothetical protein